MIRNFFGRHRIVFSTILFLGIILSCSCAEKHTGSAEPVKNSENTYAVDSDTSGHSGKSISPHTSGMVENTSVQWSDLIKTDSMDLTYATQFAVDYYQDDYTLITIAGQQKYLLLPDDSADDAANTSENAKDESDPDISDIAAVKPDPDISDNTTAKSDPGISDNAAAKPDPNISGSAGNIPEDLPDDIVVLKRNPKRVYIASSSCMDFWRELDELDAVWFTSTKRQDWDLPEAAERMTDGDLEFVGKYNAPDFEYLLAENCGLAVENTMIYHTPDTLEKLESLGIPVLVEYSSYEESPLGRLEWIRLWGLLTGREKEADDFFSEQVKQFSRLTETTGNAVAEGDGTAVTKSEDNTVTETAGSSTIDNGNSTDTRIVYFSINANGVIRVPKPSSYIPALIEMAGGKYALADADLTDDSQNAASSMNMQMEDFYVLAKDADVLIYNGTIEGNLASIDDLIAKNALFKDFSAVKNHRVWCQDGDLFQHPTAVAEEVTAFGEVMAGQDANEANGGKFLQKLE